MEMSAEDSLYQAVVHGDEDTVLQLLSEGANPNRTCKCGKTSLGEAAKIGNLSIAKALIDYSKSTNSSKVTNHSRKRHVKSHKRKLRHDGQHNETVVKCKNPNERTYKDVESIASTAQDSCDSNQGYFVFIHSEGSSSDEGRIPSTKSSLSPPSLATSPQADLEWDEEIGNVAPTTSEDETWSSMYKWYAAILESTGAAIAAASSVTNGIDQQDAFMRTALHYAAEQGHVGVVKLLLDAGCKLDVTASDDLTPLHMAVIKNHIEIVQMLILGGSHINYKTHEKMTALHFAASRGYTEMVKILVYHGAHLEARDTNERTALYLAAGRGHVDVVTSLISSGANINGEEINGCTPLCEAVWQRYADVVNVLLNSGARITHSHRLLHNAILQRQVDIVKMLANSGGGINLHNDSGDTPLLLATRLSQTAVVRILLEKGANVNACNSITGASALHVATESIIAIDCPNEFEQLLRCLLEYNIDMNATALTGDTALNRAMMMAKDYAAMYLIRYGADVNARDFNNCGLDNLSVACRRRSFPLARMLWKAGHFIFKPDKIVPTPAWASWLSYFSKHPLDLSDLCRIKIRSLSKNNLFLYIESLPLPRSLKRFLMMEDESV